MIAYISKRYPEILTLNQTLLDSIFNYCNFWERVWVRLWMFFCNLCGFVMLSNSKWQSTVCSAFYSNCSTMRACDKTSYLSTSMFSFFDIFPRKTLMQDFREQSSGILEAKLKRRKRRDENFNESWKEFTHCLWWLRAHIEVFRRIFMKSRICLISTHNSWWH